MKVNKRLLIEAIIVASLALLAYFGWGVVRGMVLTMKHVPDVVSKYESGEVLQQEVAFGVIENSGWSLLFLGLGAYLLMIMAYYWIRVGLIRWLKK